MLEFISIIIEGLKKEPITIIFIITALLLAVSVARFRDEMVRRLAECEDAHLERDSIQLEAVQLLSEQLGAMRKTEDDTYDKTDLVKVERREKTNAAARAYYERAQAIIDQIHAVNRKTLKKREEDRKQQATALKFFKQVLLKEKQ